jgi:hypothetical protein
MAKEVTSVIKPEHIALFAAHPHELGKLIGMDLLTELHSEWVRYLWLSNEHSSLQAHRGSYKTTSCTVLGCIWWLLFNPDAKLAIVHEKKSVACSIVREIAAHFKNPLLQEIFYVAHQGHYPKIVSEAEGHLLMSFKSTISKERSIDAHGVDSVTTGSHYDKMVCDDCIGREDRLSKAKRVRTIDGLLEIYTNIINPGCQVVHVGTPWHVEDGWSAPCMPPPRLYDVYSTNLLTEEQIQLKRKGTTPSLFAANYLLKHMSDEEQIFKDPTYGHWKYEPEGTVGHLDAKFSGDHTAALTFMTKLSDGHIQVIGYSFPENVKEKVAFIKQKYRQHRCTVLHIETNPDQGYTAEMLAKRDEHGNGLNTKDYRESSNKHNKIVTYGLHFWDILIWDGSMSSSDYMNQVLDYMEKQEPDDAPDSMASLLRQEFHGDVTRPDTLALYGYTGD